MVVRTGLLIVMFLCAALLAGCSASGTSDAESATRVPEINAAEEKAWDELASILFDLGMVDSRFEETLKLAEDIGYGGSVQSQVPYAEYEDLRDRLQGWIDASDSSYPAYWGSLARDALTATASLVTYAYDGGELLLADAADARASLRATIKAHCDKPKWSIVSYCKAEG